MKSKSALIVSVIFLTVLLHVSPNQACLKKIKKLIKNRGRQETPAELARDEAAFIKYSHGTTSNLYMEIRQNPNRTYEVRELDHPPIALNQLAGEEFKEAIVSGEASSKEPDAEYIDTNMTTTGEAGNETMPIAAASVEASNATTEAPPQPPKVDGEEEEEEEILTPEDEHVRQDWGGQCVQKDWDRCNKIRRIFVLDVIHTKFERKNMSIVCNDEPTLCLRNGWTANRCHILCMAAQCNRILFQQWDETVDFEGACRY